MEKKVNMNIQELYRESREGLRIMLREEFPELFKIEDGWYYHANKPKFLAYLKGGKYAYGFDYGGSWFDNGACQVWDTEPVEDQSLATSQNIRVRLQNYALNTLGIGPHTRLDDHACLKAARSLSFGINSGNFNIIYNRGGDELWNANGIVYKGGVWARKLINTNAVKAVDERIVNRVEVIGAGGREFVGLNKTVELSIQDGGKTLKIFIED